MIASMLAIKSKNIINPPQVHPHLLPKDISPMVTVSGSSMGRGHNEPSRSPDLHLYLR